jgi:probable F420-dependent oxidoreductase
VLAKEAATVDLLSNGRFELGIGAGWDATDYTETGICFDPPRVRVARLKEAVEIVRRAWSGETFSFEGDFYTARDCRGGPLPVQQPGPPLLIGSGAPKLLAFAARTADVVAFAPRPMRDGSGLVWSDISAEAVARKVEWVRAAAPERLDSLEISCNVFEVEVADEAEDAVARIADRIVCQPELVRESPHVWLGSVDEIVDRLRDRREQFGITYYTILGDLELLEAAAPIVAALAGT